MGGRGKREMNERRERGRGKREMNERRERGRREKQRRKKQGVAFRSL